MLDKNIKKFIIKKADLPNVIGDNDILTYNTRYRIVSEDKNRTSHWSKIFNLEYTDTSDETGFDPNDPINTSIPYNLSVDTQTHIAEISWTMPALLIPNPTEEQKALQIIQAAIKDFDVYVSWQMINNNQNSWTDWAWVGSVNTTKFAMSYQNPAPPYHIKFRVQKVTQNKQAFDAATYLISTEHNL